MLSTMLVILSALAATYTAGDKLVLTGPDFDGPSFDAQAWHNNELCPKLQHLFCNENTYSSCISFNNFFPEKDNPNFQLINDGEIFDLDKFAKIVDRVKSLELSTIGASDTDTSSITVSCVFESSTRNADDSYDIVSSQTVNFNLPRWTSLSATVSVQTVTYHWEKVIKWDNTAEYRLILLQMVSYEDPEKKLASVITQIGKGRRRLMQQKSVQFMMRMPKMISIPLIVGIVVLLVVITMIMIWKSVCFCAETIKSERKSVECEV